MNDSKSHPDYIASHINALPKSGIRDFFELVSSMGDEVISLGIGEPDFVTPWKFREAAIYGLEKGHTSYTSNLGLLSLRKEICKYVEKNFQASYDPETECIVTVGVSEALDIILRAIINPGDEVIYHEPCYVSYAPEILMAYGKPVAVETVEGDEFALNPIALEKAVTDKTKALLLNFPCNPTGASLTLAQKEAIAKIAVENDLVVITDEIYAELNYEEESVAPLVTLPGMRERTVFLNGFSKAFAMTGFRLAYACGPPALIDAMMKIHQYSMLCASIIAQEAALEALKHGAKEVATMRDEYHQRRNVIVKRLNDMGFDCVKPKGAFYVFPNISSSGLSSEEFASRLLREHGVAAVPGTAFGACGEGFLRCSYASSMENIEEAMRRMEKFKNSL